MARLLQNGDATSSWRSTHPYNSRKCGLKTHPKKIMGKNHPNSSTINSIYRWSLMIFPWVLQNWLGAIFRGNSCQKFQQSTRWTGEPKDCHVWLRIHIPNPNGWLNRLYIWYKLRLKNPLIHLSVTSKIDCDWMMRHFSLLKRVSVCHNFHRHLLPFHFLSL